MTAENVPAPTNPSPPEGFDPDEYRMTVGEHLEELRRRMIYALLGLVVSFVVCLIFGKQVIAFFCAPLLNVLLEYEVNPQMYYTGVGDVFGVYIQISLIVAGTIAAPWMLYQLWLFVAAGLYPHERKVVTRYIPLSIGLLVSGLVFVYLVVLPMTLQFFIYFSGDIPMPQSAIRSEVATTRPTTQAFVVPTVRGDMPSPVEHEVWFDELTQRYKTYWNGQVRVFQLLPANLTAPLITLPDYIDMVMMTLVLFAISFQLPIVVMAVLRIGIVEMETAKKARRVVYFACVILAAAITPGDAVTATIALVFPLVALYELGLFLGRGGAVAAEGD